MSICAYTTSLSEVVLSLEESLGVTLELSPPNAYKNVPFTPNPTWLRAKGSDASGAHAPSVPSELIWARYTVATGALPVPDPPAMYTDPLKTTAPRECSGAGSAVVVLQAVTAPVAPRVPRYTVETGLSLAVLSPPSARRYELVTGAFVGVTTSAAANAIGAGNTVVLVQLLSAPVLETVAYSTLSRGVFVLSAPPTT